jgi:transcriptional regulator with GAF, ATPase, and Fis domain
MTFTSHRAVCPQVLELPPIRKRRGDVTLRAHDFAAQLGPGAGALRADVLRGWEDSEWPGNVRELRNAVRNECAVRCAVCIPPTTERDIGILIGRAR